MKKQFQSSFFKFIGIILVLLLACKKEKDDPNKVSDIDGNVYKTVKIGANTWMAENLKTTRYNNGDLIGTTTSENADVTQEDEPKYQWAYNDDESNVPVYGRLYTYYAATDYRNICPKGWHLPTYYEWRIMVDYVGGEDVAGGNLKEKGTDHWKSPNTGATDDYGFRALPGGIRFPMGIYNWQHTSANFWCYKDENYVNLWRLYYDYSEISKLNYMESTGFCVRCVQN